MRSISDLNLRPVLISYMVFTSLMIIWELTVYLLDISQIVLVKPSDIYPIMVEDADVLIPELKYTFIEVCSGWLIGNSVGTLLGILIYRTSRIATIFKSSAVIINSIPIIALSAVVGGFIGTGIDAKILIVAILCFFPMFITTTSALNSSDQSLKDMFWVYNSSRSERFVKLDLPHSLPMIFNTLKINVVVAIFAAIVSEFFGAQGGIGALILSKKGLYDLPMVWAAIIYLIIVSVTLYVGVSILGRIINPWKR